MAHSIKHRLSIAAALLLLCGSAAGQTADELEAELVQTREELRIARATITNLRDEVAMLRARVAELEGEPLTSPTAELPGDPLSCPQSMAVELGRRYQRDLARNAPRDDDELEPFAALASDWCEEMRDDISGRREWLVRFESMQPARGSRDMVARVRVYDEVSLLPLGVSADVSVPRRVATRVEAEPEAVLWLAAVAVSADPTVNLNRATRGAFDEPLFVGPYVESGLRVEWLTIEATPYVPTADEETWRDRVPFPEPPPRGPDR